MRRRRSVPGILCTPARTLSLAILLVFFPTTTTSARTGTPPPREWTVRLVPELVEQGIEDPGRNLRAARALPDTIWIADWTFDAGGTCDDTGWERHGPGVPNDGSIHWEIADNFSGTGGIASKAAELGIVDPCCVQSEGYANDWYQAIRVTYSGSGSLSFDYLVDSETGFDFLDVEVDSACASFDLALGGETPSEFRQLLFSDSGLNLSGAVAGLGVPDFGTTDTHCLYIAFISDVGFSPCDGFQPTTIGRALVVDNVQLTGVASPVAEDFEDVLDANLSFANLQWEDTLGIWARLYPGVGGDACESNLTCSWIFTTPTVTAGPSWRPLAFRRASRTANSWSPAAAISVPDVGLVPPDIDNTIISPWVSLASTPGSASTILSFREFPGQPSGLITRSVAVRGKTAVGAGELTECVSSWGHVGLSLSHPLEWRTVIEEMMPHFDPASTDIQVRFRVAPWWFGAPPPDPETGPGPFIDRVRIGRRELTGPAIDEGIDSRSQAQDAYPTEVDPAITPGTGEHHRPTTDIFGTVAFSRGGDLGINATSPNLITGDSIHVTVQDVRGAGGVTSVEWYGAIVHGPHVGKSPPPWSVDANGFFMVPADSARNPNGQVVADEYFVDLDDDYFRGGDILHYFWLASDASGGVSSLPQGLKGVPTSVAEAEEATRGLFEVSFLPTINWSQTYLDRIAADPHGKLEPTAPELASSVQENCYLYVQQVNTRRRSGDLNRTSFMHTLHVLQQRGDFDIYDHQGLGNTNNHLGGRATIEQASGYNLIVYDAGNRDPDGAIMPDGSDLDAWKIDQASWFRQWLRDAPQTPTGFVTLWILGSDVVEERPANPLYTMDAGVLLNTSDQGVNVNPNVEGEAMFTFDLGGSSAGVDFTGDVFSLEGGCPEPRDYDGLGSAGSAVETHRYHDWDSGQAGDAAIVMNSNPMENWNTIVQSNAWCDMRRGFGTIPNTPTPKLELLEKVVFSTLTPLCLDTGCCTSTEETPIPSVTRLHQNVPNPFNPATTIEFDLAHEGHVQLRLYDVAGRTVRTLVDAWTIAGRHPVVWDGLDDRGDRVASGVYFYRLTTDGYNATRKLVLTR